MVYAATERLWLPRKLRHDFFKRVEPSRAVQGLINGGLVNDGHAMANAGIIRAHVADPYGGFDFTSIGTLAIRNRSDVDTYTDTGFTTAAVNDGDSVKGWKDQSGNVRHSTEATNAPSLKLNQRNGYPSVRFDGTNDLLTTVNWTNKDPDAGITLFFVMNQISYTNFDRVYSIGSTYKLTQTALSPALQWRDAAGVPSSCSTSDATVAAWHIVAVMFSATGGSGSIQVDGNVGSLTATGPLMSQESGSGNCKWAVFDDGTTQFGNLEFAEMLYYTSKVTAANITAAINALNAKYAIF